MAGPRSKLAPGMSIPPPPPLDIPFRGNSWSWSAPSTWPKWVVALMIGIPVSSAAAAICYNYYSSKRRIHGKKNHRGKRLDDSSKSGVEIGAGDGRLPPDTPAGMVQALKNKGNELFRTKKFEEAKRAYTEAIELARKNGITGDLAQCLQNRAACSEQLKHPEEVISDCDQAIELDPHYTKAYARRSRAFEKTGRIREAFQDLVAASILSNFLNQEYKDRSEKLLNTLASGVARDVIAKKRSGTRSIKLSRSFIRQFGTGFVRDPLSDEMKDLETYEENDPQRSALISMRSGDYDQAFASATEALKHPGSKRYVSRLLRGTLHFLTGNLDDATADLTNVLNDPDASLKEKSNARIKLACITLQKSMNVEEVTTKLTKALELDPTNPDILFHRGQCNMIFGRLEECLEDFRKCQEYRGGKDSNCAFHIAHIEFRIRTSSNPMDFAALEELEKKILKLDNPEGFVLLSQLYMEMQRFDKADEYFRKALRPDNDPHNAVVYTQQALLEMVAKENKDGSAEFLAKALAVDENYSPALELMMDLELQAGNLVAARNLYERIIDMGKSENEVLSVIQAFQLGETGHLMYEKLGVSDRQPIPIGNPSSTF